jgi:hypothetical protein
MREAHKGQVMTKIFGKAVAAAGGILLGAVMVGEAVGGEVVFTNLMPRQVQVYVDGARRCRLAHQKECQVKVGNGAHVLRAEKSGGWWQDKRTFQTDTKIDCFIRSSGVDCQDLDKVIKDLLR